MCVSVDVYWSGMATPTYGVVDVCLCKFLMIWYCYTYLWGGRCVSLYMSNDLRWCLVRISLSFHLASLTEICPTNVLTISLYSDINRSFLSGNRFWGYIPKRKNGKVVTSSSSCEKSFLDLKEEKVLQSNFYTDPLSYCIIRQICFYLIFNNTNILLL